MARQELHLAQLEDKDTASDRQSGVPIGAQRSGVRGKRRKDTADIEFSQSLYQLQVFSFNISAILSVSGIHYFNRIFVVSHEIKKVKTMTQKSGDAQGVSRFLVRVFITDLMILRQRAAYSVSESFRHMRNKHLAHTVQRRERFCIAQTDSELLAELRQDCLQLTVTDPDCLRFSCAAE